ncbi:MAG TPA: hypothetical protein VF070_32695 [Streptosporangiaceae bacterium]
MYIETYVKSHADDPQTGLITWDYDGAGNPSMTARETRILVTILCSLIEQLEQAGTAR